MAGYLYAVIFSQGTVKVGMTCGIPKDRMKYHYSDGRKFGIKVKYEITELFQTNDIEFREKVLFAKCGMVSECVGGQEWYLFESADIAKNKITEFMRQIKANEFGEISKIQRVSNALDKESRFQAAMLLVRQGVNPNEAAKRVGIHFSSVMQRQEYKSFVADGDKL